MDSLIRTWGAGGAVVLLVHLTLACTRPNTAFVPRAAVDAAARDSSAQDGPPALGEVLSDTALDSPAPADVSASEVPVDGPSSQADGPSSPPDGPSSPPDVVAMDRAPDVAGPGSSGLVLHWRFDETTGTVAADASGGGLNGTYQGNPPPSTSMDRPPTVFANPASRRFFGDAGQGVRLANPPSRLRPTAALTVSVWFRTRLTTRSDLVALGLDYFLRHNTSGEFQFVRRRSMAATNQFYAATGPAPTALDGRWHHAAGVTTVESIALWIDGVVVGEQMAPVPFLYSTGSTFLAGQSAAAAVLFDGYLDDVRIYDRALSAEEIRALAAGAH